jgi:hypothetical protein
MMENKPNRNPALPIFFVFIVIALLSFMLKMLFEKTGIDFYIVEAGNFVLFLAAVISFFVMRKGLQNANPYAFVRMTSAGMMLKMAVCIIAVLMYGLTFRSKVNKGAIFICFAFYFLYSFIEVKILLRLSKQQKNA